MTATETILIRLQSWPREELERFACKLLILSQPSFHGSKTIHYAAGQSKKIVDTITRDL